jgi:hypothetical protein
MVQPCSWRDTALTGDLSSMQGWFLVKMCFS